MSKNKNKYRRAEKTDSAEKESITKSWEFRAAKMMLRVVAAIFFIGYVAISLPYGWSWGWQTYYRNQPPSQIDAYTAKYATNMKTQKRLLEWVQVRPVIEREEIFAKLEPYSATLNPLFFLTFSVWLAEAGDEEGALEWHFIARYRMRYDALRCGSPDSVENMERLMKHMLREDMHDKILSDPARMLRYLEKVLEFDAKYPAENSPNEVCDLIFQMPLERRGIVPVNERHWRAIRHTLRFRTEIELERLREQVSAGTILTPEAVETP